MFEWILVFVVSGFIGKVAASDGKSGLIWSVVTFVVCLLCAGIPLPYIRMVIAAAISFGLLVAYNALPKKN